MSCILIKVEIGRGASTAQRAWKRSPVPIEIEKT